MNNNILCHKAFCSNLQPRPFVNGGWAEDKYLSESDMISNLDPSTGKSFMQIPAPTTEIVDLVMDSAHVAWHKWRNTSVEERSEFLHALANAIEKRRELIISIIQTETGILHHRANEEVSYGVELLRGTANLVQTSREHLPHELTDPNPYGVVLWIMSWNSPIAALCKTAAPLITGNTVILKVSHHSVVSAVLFAEAVKEANFPAGVLNVLWDKEGEIATKLVSHRLLAKCALTGRTATARNILQNMSTNFVRPTLFEIGGGGIQVIFDDADLSTALPHAFWGAFTLSGQICCAGTKIFVQESIFEQVVSEMAGWAQGLITGSAHSPDTELGPVISQAEVNRLEDLVNRAIQGGAISVSEKQDIPHEGFFVQPQILLTENINNPLYTEEIFGPIIVITPFKDQAEIVGTIDQLPTGQTLALYTKNKSWVANNLSNFTCGTIWVNGYYQSSLNLPRKSIKDDGYGKVRGTAKLREFSKEKIIVYNESLDDVDLRGIHEDE